MQSELCNSRRLENQNWYTVRVPTYLTGFDRTMTLLSLLTMGFLGVVFVLSGSLTNSQGFILEPPSPPTDPILQP